jgi:acyl-CoA synthetase (AMP-forming)/AMP-acid ligase II
MLIGDISRRNARRYPSKTAVVYADRQLSWAAVDERANRLATYLMHAGLTKGDRVAVIARNTAEWPEITYGLAKAGLVLVPVNIRLTPSEIQFIVSDSGCRAAILHTDQAEVGAGPLSHLATIVEIGGTSVGKDYEAALASGRNTDPTPSSLTRDDLHVLLYTSGTTGHPKGVMNDHRGMMAQTLDTTISTEARHEDVMLATTPFFTTGGVVRALTWLYLGQTIIIQPRFDPGPLLDAIERYHVTMTTFIPTMLIRTLRLLEEGPARDLSSLRRISYGGAPVSKELIHEALNRLRCDMQQRYGLTEAGGQVTILTPQDHRDLLAGKDGIASSCGRETPMSEIRIVDDNGDELPRGETGEIVIKADAQARGYWNRPEQTMQTFRPTGVWSGDTGWMDDEGFLNISGRQTDMIISGGFNIYPAELERVLGSHEHVELVAVVGAPHPEWGETPVAVIVPRGGGDPARLEAELRDLCRRQLGGYKQPREYEFRTELPLGPAGKVLKREIKASLARRPFRRLDTSVRSDE